MADSESLAEVRARIDTIDGELVRLIELSPVLGMFWRAVWTKTARSRSFWVA